MFKNTDISGTYFGLVLTAAALTVPSLIGATGMIGVMLRITYVPLGIILTVSPILSDPRVKRGLSELSETLFGQRLKRTLIENEITVFIVSMLTLSLLYTVSIFLPSEIWNKGDFGHNLRVLLFIQSLSIAIFFLALLHATMHARFINKEKAKKQTT